MARKDDALIMWHWYELPNNCGENLFEYRKDVYLDTRKLTDEESDDFFMLLDGINIQRAITFSAVGDTVIHEEMSTEDASKIPERISVSSYAEPEIIKYQKYFQIMTKDEVQSLIDKVELKHFRTLTFADNRERIKKPDGQWDWI